MTLLAPHREVRTSKVGASGSATGDAWLSSGSKNKLSAADRTTLNRLTSIRHQREPFLTLSRTLIVNTLDRYLPTAGRIIEIGMGDGQLYEQLPAEVLTRMVHTEPRAAISRGFRSQYRDVHVIQAPAEHLPFETGNATAVLGLCVLDVVADPEAVAREIKRVLRPGGRFIHWLDLSTVLTPIVASLRDTELLLIPNVFSDPAEGEWPEDLFAIPRWQFAIIVAILRENEHFLATPLQQYLALFTASPLAVGAITAELSQFVENPVLRSALSCVFQDALRLANPTLRQQLSTFQGQPFSSARHFADRLRGLFSDDMGFRLESSELLRAAERIPREKSQFVYLGCSVGEQRQLHFVPDILLCPQSAQVRSTLENDEATTLRELALFSFVATRI